MPIADLDAHTPAWMLVRALEAGTISSVELLDLYRRRVETFNGHLNAIVIQDFASAVQAAEECDRQRAAGRTGALLGLPHTVKDCIYVRGFPTTGGLPERQGASRDDESVTAERLRHAGSIVFGKTNVPPYAADWQSDNALFGRTLNPWDDAVTPGGSSGGSAAALAAGLTPIEFGGDLAGSIRIPAAFCGVFGHKTSEGIVPAAGHFPGPPRAENKAVGMGVQGPIARCAADLLVGLQVICGPSPAQASGWVLHLPASRARRLSDFRIAVLQPPGWLPVDSEINAACAAFCERLRECGADPVAAMPPQFKDLRDLEATYRSLLSAIEHAAMPAPARSAVASEIRAAGCDDPFLDAVLSGISASAGDYILWSGKRSFYAEAMRLFFDSYDVLLAPAQIVAAFEHTRQQPSIARRILVNGRPEPYGLMFVLPSLANLTGHPATAFPVGLTRRGLPIGMQAIGPALGDLTCVEFVAALEREAGISAPIPPGYGPATSRLATPGRGPERPVNQKPINPPALRR